MTQLRPSWTSVSVSTDENSDASPSTKGRGVSVGVTATEKTALWIRRAEDVDVRASRCAIVYEAMSTGECRRK